MVFTQSTLNPLEESEDGEDGKHNDLCGEPKWVLFLRAFKRAT
jgi:hypothetical protein